MKKRNTYILIASLILFQNICFSQESEEYKKDSIMNFLIRGLWIQYEVEKQWNPNNDTVIYYTPEEYKKYYNPISVVDLDTIYIMQDRYESSTAVFFERRTGIKRDKIHHAINLIDVLDKELINKWTNWYDCNKKKVGIRELNKIMKH